MGIIRQRHLPHWDVPNSTFFVTTCLAGSIPAQGLLEIEQYRENLLNAPRPTEISVPEWKKRCWKRVFVESEKWLDLQPAVRYLADPTLAGMVANSIYYFAGERYDLLAYVVMPSHFHWVFRPVGQVSNLSSGKPVFDVSSADRLETCPTFRSPREQIMHSIKLYTARRCNQHLKRCGAFWQDESHDHCVRDAEELERIIDYIENNPVKAGLARTSEEWPFSSARDRIQQNIEFGQPLRRT
jgi:REP element-mobilizing transposase RayT